MGVSCVCKLLASAVVALGSAGCASMPYALGDPMADAWTLQKVPAGAEELARRCHDALVAAAEPYDLSKALTSPLVPGQTVGPIRVTMVYRRRGGFERRTALIDCRFDDKGEVVAFAEHAG